MGKIIKLNESSFNRLVKQIIKEDEQQRVAYGREIRNLDSQLGSDEYVKLTDYGDQLRGDIVKKKEYVIHMLKGAIREEDWSAVRNTIQFIENKM
jgi:hypothetical protein